MSSGGSFEDWRYAESRLLRTVVRTLLVLPDVVSRPVVVTSVRTIYSRKPPRELHQLELSLIMNGETQRHVGLTLSSLPEYVGE